MVELNLDLVNKMILTKHHLTPSSKINDILTITDDLCGLHGTGTIEPYLSLFSRMHHFKKEFLDKELYINKNLGRIRGMRKTLFIETKEMIPIVYNLIKSQTAQRDEMYLKYTGISKGEYETISDQILTLLSQEELSTSEIKKKLNSKKDITAIVSVMCDEMLLIRGKPLKSWRDRRIYYVPFNTYFPDIDLNKYSEPKAVQILIEKYIRSYGPITEDDIAWWLGTTKTKVKNALSAMKPHLEKIKIEGLNLDYFLYKSELDSIKSPLNENEIIINVLPGLDPYIMGYKNRERYVANNFYDYVFDSTGNGTTTILINGSVVGIWDFIEKPEPLIKIYIFKKSNSKIMEAIEATCQKLGRFLSGKNVRVKECNKMVPLTKQTRGRFMSPLKEC